MKFTQEKIMAIAVDKDTSIDTRLSALIDIGLLELQLDTGIVSKIDGQNYFVHYSNYDELNKKSYRLGDTYCAITVRLPHDDVLAVKQFSVSPYFRHPAYEKFKLETYIGTTIQVDEKIHGTLVFTKAEPRDAQFTDAERQLVLWLSEGIGSMWSQIEIKD